MNYDNELLDKVYEMYQDTKIGNNFFCEKCKNYSSDKKFPLTNGPIPIFHIGKDYKKQDKRLLIIGKVAYGWSGFGQYWPDIFEGNIETKNFMKNSIEERVEVLFYSGENKYFSFLKNALTQVYDNIDLAFNNVAITNVVHCNDGNINDYLRQDVRSNCASKSANGFIHKEIEILNPTHILLLTKSIQRKYERYFEGEKLNIRYIEHPSNRGRSMIGFTNEIIDFLKNDY